MPADPNVGYARCMNAGCEQAAFDREIVQRRDECVRNAYDENGGQGGAFASMVINTTEHVIADPQDLICPACGGDCAHLPEPARVIPKMMVA